MKLAFLLNFIGFIIVACEGYEVFPGEGTGLKY
jgi:hypothetical protein